MPQKTTVVIGPWTFRDPIPKLEIGGVMTRVGERVELVHTNDPHTKLKPGARGTVSFIDDMGTVHVNWDDGGRLGMIEADGDRFVVISPAEMSQAPSMPK